jgi:hypothetical protein
MKHTLIVNGQNRGTGSVRKYSYAEGVGQFQPKGWSEATTLGRRHIISVNPERVRRLANPFRVWTPFSLKDPGFSLHSNPGLKLANAFGVISKLNHYANLICCLNLQEGEKY